jgi:hypothetical protein
MNTGNNLDDGMKSIDQSIELLSIAERKSAAEIFNRRANEIATFRSDLESKLSEREGNPLNISFPGSVEMALEREISRLRRLAAKIDVPDPDDE